MSNVESKSVAAALASSDASPMDLMRASDWRSLLYLSRVSLVVALILACWPVSAIRGQTVWWPAAVMTGVMVFSGLWLIWRPRGTVIGGVLFFGWGIAAKLWVPHLIPVWVALWAILLGLTMIAKTSNLRRTMGRH
jgi:hypothetical protein